MIDSLDMPPRAGLRDRRRTSVPGALLLVLASILGFADVGSCARLQSDSIGSTSVPPWYRRLVPRIQEAHATARSRDAAPTERDAASERASEFVAEIVRIGEECQLPNDWYYAGWALYSVHRYDLVRALWDAHLDEIAEQRKAFAAASDLYVLSTVRRLGADWTGTVEVLDRMDRVAARPDLDDETRAACLQYAIAERIRYLLEIGDAGGAYERLPAYEEAFRGWPDRPEARLDVVVRVHRSLGDVDVVVREIEAFAEAGGEPSPDLRLFQDLAGLRMARIEGGDPTPWVDSVRERLESSAVVGRERVQACFELFGEFVRGEDHEGAAWCLDEMRRAVMPIGRGAESATARDEILVNALDASLAFARGADREALEAHAALLDASFDRLMILDAARPYEGAGSSIGAYDREHALFGAMLDVRESLHGDAGLIEALERISHHPTLAARARRMGVEACTIDEVRRELLVDDAHGILLVRRNPIHTGGCRLIALDRTRVVQVRIGTIKDLQSWGRRLIEELRSPNMRESDWSAVSEAALAWLLPAEARELFDAWSKVTLVGLDSERSLPFESLFRDGRPIGASVEVDYVSSLSMGVHLARRRSRVGPPTAERLVLAIAPEHSPAARREYADLDPVRLDDRQVRELCRGFSDDSLTLLRGDQVTRESLPGSRVTLLSLMAHGIAAATANEAPGILLASRDPNETGVLRMGDVAGVQAAAVGLWSCGTGTESARPMEAGLGNLAGSFLESGADVVVFSHETLQVAPTVELAAVFTERIALGATPSAAMRDARAELVRRGITDPRLHSTLRLWGIGHRPLVSPAFADRVRKQLDDGERGIDPRIAITVVVLVVAAALLVWSRRNR